MPIRIKVVWNRNPDNIYKLEELYSFFLFFDFIYSSLPGRKVCFLFRNPFQPQLIF